MTLDPTQQTALSLLQSGENVFLTGGAGTGKSTVTTEFIGSSMRRVDVVASTGIAAINLRDSFAAKSGGRKLNVGSLHRWMGAQLGPKDDQSFENFWEWWRYKSVMSGPKMSCMARIRMSEVVVIDETSMISGRFLDYMDFHCRMIRNIDKPFGGIQVIAVGDFLQLPPVNKGGGPHDFAFLSKAWEAADFKPAVLTKVHRQADMEFVNLLNEFRVGRISRNSVRLMNACVKPFPNARIPRLFTRNMEVDKWNGAQLEGLPGETVTFKAMISGERESERKWLMNSLVTPMELELRVGARIMVTANLQDEHGEMIACNGTIGYVLDISETSSTVTIETDEGRVIDIKRNVWDFDMQVEDSAKFFQLPLRLAWASTIHKAQGLTLNEAFLDIRSAIEPGQAYVGLSRVRGLDGLWLKDVPAGVSVSPIAVRFQESLTMAAAKPVCLY